MNSFNATISGNPHLGDPVPIGDSRLQLSYMGTVFARPASPWFFTEEDGRPEGQAADGRTSLKVSITILWEETVLMLNATSDEKSLFLECSDRRLPSVKCV